MMCTCITFFFSSTHAIVASEITRERKRDHNYDETPSWYYHYFLFGSFTFFLIINLFAHSVIRVRLLFLDEIML